MTDDEKIERDAIVERLMIQRNNAQNEVVQLAVALKKAERTIDELKAKLDEKEAPPKTNGVDHQQAAPAH